MRYIMYHLNGGLLNAIEYNGTDDVLNGTGGGESRNRLYNPAPLVSGTVI